MVSTLSSMMVSTTNSVEINDEYATRHNTVYMWLKMRICNRKQLRISILGMLMILFSSAPTLLPGRIVP